MERKDVQISFLLITLCTALCLADRQLDRSEILLLFERLTSEPRNTWISAGTIEASHEEYRAAKVKDEGRIRAAISENVADYQADSNKPEQTEYLQKLQLDAIPFNTRYELSNEYTMSSTESVKYDGQRFKWEINIDSRIDSVKPAKDLEGNFMTNQFDMKLNAQKVYVWDGENYIVYSPLAEHAYVDATNEMPHSVNGPLTAGTIPWGYGYYSYDNLDSLESAAFERNIDGRPEILLTLDNEDGSQMSFVLDPSLQYAVIFCSITGRGNASVSKYYSDFEYVSSRWVPKSIVLEKYNTDSQKLLARDIWTMTIDANIPQEDSFKVDYEEDTLIEYASPITSQPLIYCYSLMANTDILLSEKLSLDAEEGTYPQNCATVSMKYALDQLGIHVSYSQLAALVNETNNGTSLYDMKHYIQDLGLNCRAVQTDLETIKELGDCQIILLYFPGKKHFVVLESIDSEYVRLIDLASRKFYYRIDISFFDMDWTTGVALIISDNAIKGNLQDLNDNELNNIVGASGYTCTRLLQEYHIIYCEFVGGECLGYYTIYWQRYGCEAAESGSCSTNWYPRLSRTPCIEDVQHPDVCKGTGDWTDYWMRACM
jgi:hypothetical protein